MLTKRDFGFWRLVGSMRLRSFFWPEGIPAIIVGLISAYCLNRWATADARLALAGDYLVLASVLVGVVFATMALVVSLLSDSYLLFLSQGNEGFLPFMAPFVVGIGVQLLAIGGSLAYRVAAPLKASCEPWLFTIVTVLIAYALFDIISLAKTVVAHAVTRAQYLAVTAKKRESD